MHLDKKKNERVISYSQIFHYINFPYMFSTCTYTSQTTCHESDAYLGNIVTLKIHIFAQSTLLFTMLSLNFRLEVQLLEQGIN